jgi:hypothetical protein
VETNSIPWRAKGAGSASDMMAPARCVSVTPAAPLSLRVQCTKANRPQPQTADTGATDADPDGTKPELPVDEMVLRATHPRSRRCRNETMK